MISKRHILDEVKRTAVENSGKPLGKKRFEKETGIKEADWLGKYWVRWNDIIKEAGYLPNEMQLCYNEDFLLQKVIGLIHELDKFPTRAEMRMKRKQDKSFPSSGTFYRFRNKNELIESVIKYCDKHDVDSEILAICYSAKNASIIPELNENKEDNIDYGFVYLMKSGKNFKIGRSSSAERREYELRILLPDKPELIHKIKTDDPAGIEKYWHNRFKDKRKRGEWFALSASDIKVFKRRKFM